MFSRKVEGRTYIQQRSSSSFHITWQILWNISKAMIGGNFIALHSPTNKNERMKIISITVLAITKRYRYCRSYPSLLSIIIHFQWRYVSSPHCCYFKCLSFTYALNFLTLHNSGVVFASSTSVFSSKLPGYSCNSSTSHLSLQWLHYL